MYKILKIYEDYFAYISVSTLLIIIAILLISSHGINTFAVIFTVLLALIYSVLFLKKSQTLNEDNNKSKDEDIDEPKQHYHAIVDENYNITYFSNSFLKRYAKKEKSLLGKNLFEVLNIKSEPILSEIDKYRSFCGIVECSLDDKQLYKSLTIEPVKRDLNREYYVSSFDVTNSFKTHQELKEEFLIDKFTGLSSKSKLMDDAIKTPSRPFGANTLIFIEVDSFEEINEFFGIDAGNKIISYVANWLNSKLPIKESKLYKLDRNSFAILIDHSYSSYYLNNYLKMISTSIKKETFYFQNIALNISFTIGAAKCKTNIIRSAYHALNDAKNLKKSYKIYNKNSNYEAKFIHNIKMNQAIKDAILEDRIEPFFQPIYNIKSNEVEKFESLIRIQTRNGTFIRPADFLDIARKSNLYLDLSKAMIKNTLNKLEKLKFPVTINISADDILDKKVSGYILRNLETNNNGHLITFEIVESQEISNNIKVTNFIRKVKLLGCKIAIDDFGSGYSNFSQLPKLSVDYLKIDGSLIKDINTNPDSLIIIKSIVSFAKDLGIKTVAEFVSSQEIFDKVKFLGIDYAQGYHIGKPSHISYKN